MRKTWLIPVTIVCIFSGFFLAMQLKVMANNTLANPLSQKNTNLVMIIKDLEKEIESQETQIEKIRNTIDAMQKKDVTGNLQELQEQLKQSKIIAGLTPVAGKGIIITVDDNTEDFKVNSQSDPNRSLVHYEHLLNIVSELKVGAAEAISINGLRLITSSEIRCVGNTILINTTRIAPPFEIRAIGSPKLLAEISLNGELEILRASNYPVSLQEEDEVIIPAYKGSLQFSYAKTVKGD